MTNQTNQNKTLQIKLPNIPLTHQKQKLKMRKIQILATLKARTLMTTRILKRKMRTILKHLTTNKTLTLLHLQMTKLLQINHQTKIIQTTTNQHKNNQSKLMITKTQKANLQILNKLLTIKQKTLTILLTQMQKTIMTKTQILTHLNHNPLMTQHLQIQT